MRHFALLCLLIALPVIGSPAHASQPFTAEDLVKLNRIADPQVSPDGRHLAFSMRETDLEANRGRTDLWLMELTTDKPIARRITQHPAADSTPRWAPDGSGLYFLSSRSGSSQVWFLPFEGGEAQPVTALPLDVGSFKISPKGDRILVSLEVFPDCATLACSAARLKEKGTQKETGKTYDELFVRHWDTWKDGRLSQLFTATLDAQKRAGDATALSGKVRANVPSKPFGGEDEYTFSPDGTRVIFAARLANREEPWSTNFDLYEINADGSGEINNLTVENLAWDTQPVFLATGDLAWLAMSRPGFEADKFTLMVKSAADGRVRRVTADWDRSIGHISASADGRKILASADHLGQTALFEIDPQSGKRRTLVGEGQVQGWSTSTRGTVLAWASLGSPPELYYLAPRANATPQRLTALNAPLLKDKQFAGYEQFSFKGWNDETVYGYVMKPHGYTPGQKYPIAFIVHGGPQVSFANGWSWRWNPQVYAGAGYGVVFIDFHGSPGYGQAFTDSISGDWGGKPLVDLQKGLEAALAKYDWLDGTRACSLGASYGGFMQNWIAGQWPDRFQCLVNHAGIFDQRMMYYSTEELWFTEWENGGPYFEVPKNHEKFNPADYVTNWQTPMLVIHGALDYRVPYTQGLATFTALQRRGIESRFVFFPDENHWILKPANSLQWHEEVLGWLKRYLQ